MRAAGVEEGVETDDSRGATESRSACGSTVGVARDGDWITVAQWGHGPTTPAREIGTVRRFEQLGQRNAIVAGAEGSEAQDSEEANGVILFSYLI